MPTPILMPALSPTMTEGNLAKWVKNEGDEVKPGDVLAEIETDKATMEVEAVDEGTLGKILVSDGTDDVAVNTPIAVILSEGEKVGDIKPASAPHPVSSAPSSPPSGGGIVSSSSLAGEVAPRSGAGGGNGTGPRLFAS